jgi:hypothetical protein
MSEIQPWTERAISNRTTERRINGSAIYYESRVAYFLVDYYSFILAHLSRLLRDEPTERSFMVGNVDKPAGTRHPTRIAVQIEHTLVLPGGRDSHGASLGNIVWQDKRYLVRLDEQLWQCSDYVTEYSIPNILNIASLEKYRATYLHKILFVPPMIFPYARQDLGVPREHEVLTTFVDCNQPRRKALIERLTGSGIRCVNVTNVYGDTLRNLLLRTRILLNIHQTDHHHSLEELRILPALLCRTVVIAEDSPLKERVPYHNYVIWTSYADILETVRDTSRNYDEIYARFFGEGSELPEILEGLRTGISDEFRKLVAPDAAKST